MKQFSVHQIGSVEVDEEGMRIQLLPQYIPALQGLEGFSHLQVLWWCDGCDQPEYRSVLDTPKPYKKAPSVLGIFATRSPLRPNPIALTAVEVVDLDLEQGVIHLAYIDANHNTPVLDLKPYTPSFDRVESPGVPDWCGHWPVSLETSGDFPWEEEFTF